MQLLLEGFQSLFNIQTLFFIVFGAFLGILGGAMPGISSASAVGLALPVTFTMEPLQGIVFLTAIYSGATYGGSITATLLNVPGTPEAAVMTFDGYSLTKKGKAPKALWTALISGTVGGLLGTFVLILAAAPLAKQALNFGPPEYFSLAVFGLTVLSLLIEGSIIKSLITCIAGLLISTIGMDPITGVQRITFGSPSLFDGIQFVPVLLGIFALSEAFILINDRHKAEAYRKTRLREGMLTWKELKGLVKYMLVGTGIGIFVGIKPGGGATIASIMSYSVAKQISPNKKNFGNGQLEGLASPEAADKATVGAALIPMLTLGIPASATSAILLGAFTFQGIQPGPNLFVENNVLVYGIFASLILANFAVFALGMVGIPFFTKISMIPKPLLGIVIILLTIFGAYSYRSSMVDVWVAFIFGIIGFLMKNYAYPTAPLILGLVLAPLLETNLRQSLILSNGSYHIFFERPISLVLLILSAFFFVFPIYLYKRKKIKKTAAEV